MRILHNAISKKAPSPFMRQPANPNLASTTPHTLLRIATHRLDAKA